MTAALSLLRVADRLTGAAAAGAALVLVVLYEAAAYAAAITVGVWLVNYVIGGTP